jgi:septum formation protein
MASMENTPSPLILGSTSRYRRELLERLKLPFTVHSPQVDETPLAGELPAVLATRLALAKAHALAQQHPNALVIGSDQVADLHGEPVGKPGDYARATAQLRSMRGQVVVFQTAVALVRYQDLRKTVPARRAFEDSTGVQLELVALVPTKVWFRDYSDAEIDYYLRTEQPYDCAGSAKSEGLGIALLMGIESNDPTALIGLPLIQTCALLRQAGLNPLAA